MVFLDLAISLLFNVQANRKVKTDPMIGEVGWWSTPLCQRSQLPLWPTSPSADTATRTLQGSDLIGSILLLAEGGTGVNIFDWNKNLVR
jgi:hypothetical protein